MNKQIKLRSCPFCGKFPSIIATECKDNGYKGFYIHHDCWGFETIRTHSHDTELAAIDVWNRRYGTAGNIQETITHFENKLQQGVSRCRIKHYKTAIAAMRELQEYRQIGTLEECREAREKQNPMKVTDIHVDEYYCPACGAENCCDQGVIGDKYCPQCGQALEQEGNIWD